MMEDFIRAWEGTRPPPCEACRFYEHCATEREACTLFAAYVGEWDSKFRSREPSRKIYNDLYTDFTEYIPERHGSKLGETTG